MTCRLSALVLTMSLFACGDGERFVKVGKGKPTGAASEDAAVEGGSEVGGDAEGGTGAARDGSVPADGGIIDGAADDGGVDPNDVDPTKACDVAQENSEFTAEVDFVDEGGFALTVGVTGFGLAFHSKGVCKDSLSTLHAPSAGAFGQAFEIFEQDCWTIEDVALVWTPAGWRMAWIDNYANSREIETLALDDDLKPPAQALRSTLTNDSLSESRPVMADIAGVAQLAWISRDTKGNARILGKRMDGLSGTVDLLASGVAHQPTTLAVAQMGAARGTIAWVEDQGENTGVWLRSLDEAGKATGEPVRLSKFTSTGSSVDLATRSEDGGAAIYSVVVQGVNREVRFRRLDDKGAPLGEEIKIVGAPLQARDASLARIAGGYVVAYRALPGGVIKEPQIRFAFVTKEGNVQKDATGRFVSHKLADASADGGRTTVRVSLDGQVLVGFLDGGFGGKRALRLVRQRLDCGL